VEFDKAGLINYAELKEDFETNRTVKTPEVEALEKRIRNWKAENNRSRTTAAAQAESAKKIYSEKVDAHFRSPQSTRPSRRFGKKWVGCRRTAKTPVWRNL
jgi:hypothetical protein